MPKSSPPPSGSKSTKASTAGSHSAKRPRKGNRTSNACEACKKRKTKCSGVIPCEACVAQDVECVIDTSRDMRRRTAIQRMAKETKPYQHTLEAVLDLARDDNPQRIQDIVQYARRMPSAEAAATTLKDNLLAGRTLTENSLKIATSDSGPKNVQSCNVGSSGSLLSSPVSPGSRTKVESPSVESFSQRPFSSRGTTIIPGPLQSGEDFAIDLRRFWHPCLQLLPDIKFAWDSSSGLLNEDEVQPYTPDRAIPAHPNQLQAGIEVRLPDLISDQADASLRVGAGPNVNRLRVPIHLIQPLSAVENSVLCRVYTDFLRAARHMIDTGTIPAHDLMGGEDIDVDLFFRPRRPDDGFTASSWACEVVSRIREFDNFMRLAWIVLLTRLMRWLLMPTKETYAKVPEMMRPVCAQRLIPHVASIDTCPLPVLREALIHRLRDWVSALSKAGCTVNWDGTADDAIVKDADTGRMRLTERFCGHAVQFENWTVNDRILEDFPELEGRMSVLVEEEGGEEEELSKAKATATTTDSNTTTTTSSNDDDDDMMDPGGEMSN